MRNPTDHQVQQLYAALDPSDPFTVRDRALLELLEHTGLRVGELTALTVHAVSCNGVPRHDLVVVGKNRREGVIPLNPPARQAISAILAFNAHHGFPMTPQTPLLFNKYRVPMTSRGVQLIMQHLRERAQLDVPLSPHSMRHHFATSLVRRGVSLPVVQELLRHKHITATERYLHASPYEMRRAVNQLAR